IALISFFFTVTCIIIIIYILSPCAILSAVCACAAESSSSCGVPVVSSRIVGGTDAVIGEWPWQVAVTYNDYFICGGSLINTQWVLSAAHCFDFDPTPSKYLIYMGLYQLNANFQNTRRSSVEKIIINSQYSSAAGKGDIALVKMTNPVIYTDYILPICLPTMYVTFPTGMDCWVTGWGRVNAGGESRTLIIHSDCN
uniref:Peptidase S1 domain-containing protein n=1 Tax=Leptobrachium leishanense TaxID=445787 RepID=A0A8C5PZ33_9ANUR